MKTSPNLQTNFSLEKHGFLSAFISAVNKFISFISYFDFFFFKSLRYSLADMIPFLIHGTVSWYYRVIYISCIRYFPRWGHKHQNSIINRTCFSVFSLVLNGQCLCFRSPMLPHFIFCALHYLSRFSWGFCTCSELGFSYLAYMVAFSISITESWLHYIK